MAKATSTDQPTETRLDTNVTEPSTTAPGDAPYDTTDPAERASTVTPQPSAEALAVGTVNGVLPLPAVAVAADESEHRIEEYDEATPAGEKIRIRHNIDTGTTERI